MPKTTNSKIQKQMIKVSIIAYIPAPDFNLESFKAADEKIKKIRSVVDETAYEVQRFTTDQVGRQYSKLKDPDPEILKKNENEHPVGGPLSKAPVHSDIQGLEDE